MHGANRGMTRSMEMEVGINSVRAAAKNGNARTGESFGATAKPFTGFAL